MSIKSYWWKKAKEAAAICGWFPTVILAQWQLETANFTSNNLTKNNNIAGQTWQPYMGENMKGTPRPSAEGGYYIRYSDPVDGYTDFILKNGRYSKVKDETSEEGQIRAIAAAGWAADPAYASKLISILEGNRKQGYVLEVDYVLDKGVALTILRTWLKPSWEEAFKAGDTKQCDYIALLGQELRRAADLPADAD